MHYFWIMNASVQVTETGLCVKLFGLCNIITLAMSELLFFSVYGLFLEEEINVESGNMMLGKFLKQLKKHKV